MPSLEEVLDNLSDLPTLPDVIAKLTQLIANPKTTATDINDALSRDPGLSAKILRIVNSSYYGFSRRIATITNAVVILGFNQVRNLALSAFIFDNFAGGKDRASFSMKDFWKHSIGVAFVSAELARKLDPKLEEDAFICGLLHDLGKCVMAQKAEEDMLAVLKEVKKRDILFIQAERDVLSYDHAQLGAAIVERWNLPEILVDVIRRHHDPLELGIDDRTSFLAALVHVGDIVARALLMGSGGDAKIPRLEQPVWDLLGLDWGQVETVCRRSIDEFLKSDIFFSTR